MFRPVARFMVAALGAFALGATASHAQPTMVDPRLSVSSLVDGLTTPISMAFIGRDDLLVLEKNTGRVRRITRGEDRGVVLDLAVNFASERGLLGIAVHPNFPSDRGVYLFWTCRTATPPPDVNFPTETLCGPPELGADTDVIPQVPLLGNRVDRFRWTGSELVWDQNLISLRSFQADGAPVPPGQGDEGQPARGNHNGGVLRFGHDGKLYVLYGDQGRRGQLQNLPSGPTLTGLGPIVPDDQFGGPQPDDEHLAGVILRLNDDGTTPSDNPFFAAGATMGGEVGRNLQRTFAYGFRNSFGMAFDPASGDLWTEENGEDAYDEINRVEPGMNGGWIQVQGPLSRVADYRAIETTSTHGGDTPGPNLQQLRWGPERIATTPAEAQSRFFVVPGSEYRDPEFSWRHVIAPAAIGFADGRGLGEEFAGDLFVGLSVPLPEGGPLLRFDLSANRRGLAFDDSRLADLVADNPTFNSLGESESLLVGRGFGVVTDIQTGPNRNLFVVSLTNGAIYEISGPRGRRPADATESVAEARAGDGFATALSATRTLGGEPLVRFTLDVPQRARVTIHDLSGRRVASVLDRELPAGEHSLAWPRELGGQGVYFVRLEAAAAGAPLVRTVKVAVIR